ELRGPPSLPPRRSSDLDLDKARELVGEPLSRADPRRIREETGFAIGGVSPLGHPDSVQRYADNALTGFSSVWAAAGAHDAVFKRSEEQRLNSSHVKISY